MPDFWWKALERRVARRFGAERTPLSGGASRITRSDSLHPELYIETKGRARHTAVALWRDTAAKAKVEGKVPVVVLAEKGCPGTWLLVRTDDLQAVACAELRADGARAEQKLERERGSF